MRKTILLGAAAIYIGVGAVEANAAIPGPDIPSWSTYSKVKYSDAPSATMRAPAIARRSPYTLNNPEGPLNDFYKGVGLSDDPGDCASKGCSVSNGG
jgi:hypothetical protein